jgi:hypothetical protein
LKWLGFERDIPRSILSASDEAMKRYFFAIAFKTALRTYQAVRGLVTPELEPLLMPQLLAVRETISEAFDVKLDTRIAIAKQRRMCVQPRHGILGCIQREKHESQVPWRVCIQLRYWILGCIQSDRHQSHV